MDVLTCRRFRASFLQPYDPVGRLRTAVNNQWGLSWGYDRYGNRLNQALTSGSGFQGSVNVDPATNRITGSPYTHDASGNMTNDGSNTLAYDAANHLISSSSASSSGTYTYDGNHLPIKKVSGSTSTVYLFSGTKVIAEYDNGAAVASPSREYIYSGSRLLATSTNSGTSTTTTYHHPDQLSVRIDTDGTSGSPTYGQSIGQQGHYPFGEQWYDTGNTSKTKFTTYERDPESGNDYAMMRSHINRLGRFSSADLLSGSPSNPESLNRYSYALNDPINVTDPFGLDPPPPGTFICFETEDQEVCISIGGRGRFFGPLPMVSSGEQGGTGGSKKKPKKKKDCFAELKFNSNPARYGAPAGATHSFWYVQDRTGNQYIVSAGPTGTGGSQGYGALNVWGPNTPVTEGANNSGANKASDITHWSTGSSPDNCDAVDKLLAAARQFPNNSIPYNPSGPNSNSAANALGSAAGFNPTPPPGSWGWNLPLHP